VLIIDELDFLVTKDQAVIYNLFEWTQQKKSRLVVLAIANTMNLPEKLKPRVVSRMGDHRVVFRQYTAEQIETIIRSRLQGLPIFQENTVRFASKKISNCSSDIRKVMAVLSQSVELAMKDTDESKVTIDHVQKAFELFFDSPVISYISGMGPSMQVLLIFMFLELKHNAENKDECQLTRIQERLIHTDFPRNTGQLIIQFGQLHQLGLVKTRE